MTENDIRGLLRQFVRSEAGRTSVVGKVVSVDEENCTCILEDDEIQIFDVRLCAIVGTNKGIVTIPKIGSFALAVRVEADEEYMVVAATEIEKVQVKVSDESVKDWISDFISAIRAMKFTTNAGPTIQLINDIEFKKLQDRIDKILF